MGPNGVPVISGSSEAQGGGGGPSPGFFPVDPGNYWTPEGIKPYAGRGADPEYTRFYNQLASQGYMAEGKDIRNDPESFWRALALLDQGTPLDSDLLRSLGYGSA